MKKFLQEILNLMGLALIALGMGALFGVRGIVASVFFFCALCFFASASELEEKPSGARGGENG